MKIGFDVREIQKGKTTGTARFLKNILSSLPDGEEFFFYGDAKTDCEYFSDKKTLRILQAKYVFLYDQVELVKAIQKDKIDVFISPYYKIPFFAKCKKIITIHDLIFLHPMVRKGFELIKPYKTYLNFAIKKTDKILTVSEFSKSEIINQFSEAKQKIIVVYNGVDHKILKKYKTQDKENYIFFCGNDSPHKNFANLEKAFFEVLKNKEYENLILKVVGIKNENNTKNVEYKNKVNDEELMNLFAKAKLFVFPSFLEGFGFPPLEALCVGTQVLSSDTACLPEILGNNVEYFNPNDIYQLKQKIMMLLKKSEIKEFENLYSIEKFRENFWKVVYDLRIKDANVVSK